MGIKIWVIIFLIIGFGLQFLGKTLKFIGSGFTEFNLIEFSSSLLFMIVGIVILLFSNKFIVIK